MDPNIVKKENLDEELNLADDLAPSPGIFVPEVPEQQQEQVSEERAMIVSAAPLLDTIAGWFDVEMAKAKTIEGIDLTNGIKAESQILAKADLYNLLNDCKLRLENLRRDHLSN